jgi:hypothetical protein
MVLTFRQGRVEKEPNDAEYLSIRDIVSTRLITSLRTAASLIPMNATTKRRSSFGDGGDGPT